MQSLLERVVHDLAEVGEGIFDEGVAGFLLVVPARHELKMNTLSTIHYGHPHIIYCPLWLSIVQSC